MAEINAVPEHITIIKERSGIGGIAIAALIGLFAIAVFAWFTMIKPNQADLRDASITAAAQKVGNAANKVGNAADQANKNMQQ